VNRFYFHISGRFTIELGSEALSLFAPGKFDLVFIDYFMPLMTGDKLAAL